MESHKIHVPNHQPVMIIGIIGTIFSDKPLHKCQKCGDIHTITYLDIHYTIYIYTYRYTYLDIHYYIYIYIYIHIDIHT